MVTAATPEKVMQLVWKAEPAGGIVSISSLIRIFPGQERFLDRVFRRLPTCPQANFRLTVQMARSTTQSSDTLLSHTKKSGCTKFCAK